jgi:hypothetical protein
MARETGKIAAGRFEKSAAFWMSARWATTGSPTWWMVA